MLERITALNYPFRPVDKICCEAIHREEDFFMESNFDVGFGGSPSDITENKDFFLKIADRIVELTVDDICWDDVVHHADVEVLHTVLQKMMRLSNQICRRAPQDNGQPNTDRASGTNQTTPKTSSSWYLNKNVY